MDIASLIGLILAIGLIFASIALGNAPMTAFIDIPSLLIVVGGAIGAALICFPINSMLRAPVIALKVLLNRSEDRSALISQIVELAETARRDGLLALEARVSEIDNSLVRTGIQMAVDGNSPEVVEEVLRTEVEAIATRHREGKSIMDQLGRFAPAYGMIGTLIGLIMMLQDMGDPSGIGAGMAVALITTLYGAIIANVFFSPFAEKLGLISRNEMVGFEIAIRGVMAIQSGESPRAINQKLRTFLPPKQRGSE